MLTHEAERRLYLIEFPGSPGSSPYRTALPVRSAVPALTKAVVAGP